MPDADLVTQLRQLQRRPPECPHDTRVGHRLKLAGRPDRHCTVLPALLARYAAGRLHEYDETHGRGI